MSICPEATEMRRFYGGIVLSLLFDVVLLGVYLYLRYKLEPRIYAVRRARKAAMLEGGSVASHASVLGDRDHEGLELEPLSVSHRIAAAGTKLASLVPGLGQKDGGSTSAAYSMLGNGDGHEDASMPASMGQYVQSAKSILESGFRRCNANLHLDIQFEGLSLTLPPPHSKTILNGVCGRIRPGKVTAIMGPSGAGKTTFLSVLMGRVGRTAGSLCINGKVDEMWKFKKVTGFVPQDDIMMRELTVRENILFSARVRLPRHGWSEAQVQAHVDAVIDVLGLTECADTLSEKVSGGQRKRTNIGMELAMAPAAIFLDEPTSGLDATAALEVCNTLKAIADLGLTVVAVIHQPRLEIFETFDDLLLLAPGGLTVFMGPQRLVLPYFEDVGFSFATNHNPADDLLDFVAGKGNGADAVAMSLVSRLDGVPDIQAPVPVPSSPLKQYSAASDGGFSVKTLLATARKVISSIMGTESDDASGAPGMHYVPSFALDKSMQLSTDGLASPLATSSFTPTRQSSTGTNTGSGSKKMSYLLAKYWNAYGQSYLQKLRSASSRVQLSQMSTTSEAASPSAASAMPSASFAPAAPDAYFAPISDERPQLRIANIINSEASGMLEHGNEADTPSTPSLKQAAMTQDRGASFAQQLLLCHNRSMVQQYRQATGYVLEMGVGMLAGAAMGAAASQVPELYMGILKPPYTLISPAPLELLLPSIGLYIALAIGLAGSPAGVRTFGEEKAVYFREAASGHSKLAYYTAKTVSMLYRLTSGAFHFAAVFHCLASPAIPFTALFVIVLCQYYAVYGLAAVTSMVVSRENSALLGVIASLIAGCLCGFGPSLVQFRDWGVGFVPDLSYARWANEAWFDYETRPYRSKYLVEEVSAPLFGYTLDRFAVDITMMLLIGTAYRAIAYVLLVRVNRDKQR